MDLSASCEFHVGFVTPLILVTQTPKSIYFRSVVAPLAFSSQNPLPNFLLREVAALRYFPLSYPNIPLPFPSIARFGGDCLILVPKVEIPL
jgi:hypothetical protein